MAAIYKPTEAIQLLRPITKRPISVQRKRAARVAFSTSRPARSTETSKGPLQPTRRAVTIANDTGAVRWSELSPGEKASRTVQQSFNLSVVLVGVVMTCGVGYFLFADVFSPDSKTAHFNRATTAIRAHPECQRLLGPGNEIAAHGEASWSRLARNRYLSSSTETDKWGTEHLRFRFYVEGPVGQGVAHVHLTKRPSQNEYEYHTLAVDVKGHQRIYLENADGKSGGKIAPKIFGARWW
ncbi:TIM21-domain-containing protein [Karstenula rhodostoma CBS 690.94]|uniref:Mitochondrial import inner membrane translocase subunit Tim21 n=1 Tax=Karstenula rhodostoma CBS 690.94 TaxID=1392251 RepID=A0A9P4U6B9_9PLEO|nr:TIM21-domain-containing protein [Karstenula rhodostoma CBS 690.94]